MAYAGTNDLRAYLKIVGTVDNDLLQTFLDEAQAAIDAHCRTTFEATVQTRQYNEFEADLCGDVLYLDEDLLSIDTLVNGDAATISGTLFWLEPRNRSPKYAIRLKSSEVWTFNTDESIIVAGTWGYAEAVPRDIRRATLRLAAFYYHGKDAQTFEVTSFPDLGEVRVPQAIPNDVLALLSPYRRSQYR